MCLWLSIDNQTASKLKVYSELLRMLLSSIRLMRLDILNLSITYKQ